MAENKKSFILYADNKSIIEMLSDAEAGLLLKTLFSYVNDENPIIDSSIKIVFEMIKLQLKRDLKKWESTKEVRSLAGKASAEAKKIAKLNQQNSTNSTNVNFVQQKSTKLTVSDNVNVSVSVNDSVNVNESVILNNNEKFYQELITSESWLETTAMQSANKFNVIQVKEKLLEFTTFITLGFDIKNNKQEYASHFLRWLNTKENSKHPKKPYFNSPA